MTTEPRSAPPFAGLSVRTRITVAVAVLVGLALTGAGSIVYALESAHIEDEVARQIDQELAEFSRFRTQGIDPETGERPATVERLIRVFLLRNVPDDDELLLGYLGGRAVVRQGTSEHARILDDANFRQVVATRQRTGGSARVGTDQGEVVVSVQQVQDTTTSGAFVIANFLKDEHEELNRVITSYAIVSVLSLGLITAIAAWQAGRLLRPVRSLRDAAQEITETDLSRRLPESGNDDITDLTRTFNEMVARLERAFTGQREFLDDAGHELKTPLTVIRGHMELVDTTDPEEVESTRVLLLDEIDRMSRLVNDLIMLAKTDRPDFFSIEPVNVAPFVENVLDKCRALAPRCWTIDQTDQFMAEIDEQRITQALLQLAQNAVKHTDEGDEIALGSRVDSAHGLQLWVRDTGRGVSDADKIKVFERFSRGAVSANDDGFGLGLSIVSAIARAHGGSVSVVDGPESGAVFTITLPVRRREATWPAS